MMIDYNSIIGKHVKIICVFGNTDTPIYYDGTVMKHDPVAEYLIITDKFSRIVYLDTVAIKQVVIV